MRCVALWLPLLLVAWANPSGAAVIDVPDVMGFGAFQDTATNRVWLDHDNFYGSSYQQILDQIPPGFRLATLADVEQLFSSLPDVSDPEYRTTDCAIMGATCVTGALLPDLRGFYDDQLSSGRLEGEIQRQLGLLVAQSIERGTQLPDLGAWVVAVPEPNTLVLVSAGFVALAGWRRWRRLAR